MKRKMLTPVLFGLSFAGVRIALRPDMSISIGVFFPVAGGNRGQMVFCISTPLRFPAAIPIFPNIK